MPWQGSTAQTKRPCLTTPPGNHLFYPRPPRGGRPAVLLQLAPIFEISIHALREEGDLTGCTGPSITWHFYPRPPRGGRRSSSFWRICVFTFLSTPSARRATSRSGPTSGREKYFYPRPPRGGRPHQQQCPGQGGNFYPRPPRGGRLIVLTGIRHHKFISIHALREEGDLIAHPPCTYLTISIHALREEGDFFGSHSHGRSLGFLSTPSARRATDAATLTIRAQIDFYPRPPRGGRRWTSGIQMQTATDFYPRPPRGGRPHIAHIRVYILFNFYPRPPRGGRPVEDHQNCHFACQFLSTPSARRATRPMCPSTPRL